MLTQLLAAVFLLGVCIFFHELGHFLIGKWVGVKPKIFSIGYGRGIFFKRKNRTIYQVTAIPLGGYVQFYGDDITKEHSKIRKGDFFSVGPWRRIALAFGGPLFSVLFGFVIIFTMLTLGWQPMTNEIRLASENTPAAKAGLLDGDRIVKVNGHKTDSFEELSYYIGMASSSEIHLKVARKEQTYEVIVQGKAIEQGMPYQIGVKPAGKDYLVVQSSPSASHKEILPGDKLLSVDGVKVTKISQLRKELDPKSGKSVEVLLMRNTGHILKPGEEQKVLVLADVKSKEYLELTNITDLQTGKLIDKIEVGSWVKGVHKKISVQNQVFPSWESMSATLTELARTNKKIRLQIGDAEYEAHVRVKRRGLLGISLAEGVDSERAQLPGGFVSTLSRSVEYTIFAGQSTLVGLYRIIEGKLSFRKSISGPVKIMAIAAASVEQGWETYFYLLFNITIVLGIMNLLPIPVLDGGHIVFYLIEALYKPLPPSVISGAIRIGLAALITLGIYVIGIDLWDVFLHKLFGG